MKNCSDLMKRANHERNNRMHTNYVPMNRQSKICKKIRENDCNYITFIIGTPEMVFGILTGRLDSSMDVTSTPDALNV